MTSGSEVISEDQIYRYKLVKRWDPSRPPVIIVVLNDDSNDLVIDRCEIFGKHILAGSVIILNVFAFRCTDKRDLLLANKSKEERKRIIGPENDVVMYNTFMENPMSDIICAWGTFGSITKRDQAICYLIKECGRTLKCFQKTTEGHPRAIEDLTTPKLWPVVYKERTNVIWR